MAIRFDNDPRIVMTLDAGGTNLKFSAIRGNKLLTGPVSRPTEAHDLDRCLANIIAGFEEIRAGLDEAPVAISFAFPGPADYARGIVTNTNNLPSFRHGVALGPMLADHFGLPAYLNNDGDLFVYGEAIAGLLPYVNQLLEQAGTPKRYQNLFGITLGTGFGGGIVSRGELLRGDNSNAGEAWLLRHKLDARMNAEEGVSIRAVRSVYARVAGIPLDAAPEPKTICAIGLGQELGDQAAARAAFRAMGEVAGDAVAQALTLVDGLVVVGGGISAAAPLFLPALVDAMNDVFPREGEPMPRLVQRTFNLEDPQQRATFLRGAVKEVVVPGSGRKISFDPLPRTAVGLSRLGTSEAVSIGAYAYALNQLDGAQV
jgi:glucokinase